MKLLSKGISEMGHRIILFVDGYNVINAWSELNKHLMDDFEGARQKLNDYMFEYAAYYGEIVYVVYDAYQQKNKNINIEKRHGVYIVYTKSNQTADAYIEKKVEELENQVKEYLTRLKSTHKVPSSSAKNSSTEENKNNTANSPQDVDQEETLAMIIARKEAQIAKTQEMYEKRPKRQFIGARAKESRFAM